MSRTKQRYYLTAIHIIGGIITLVEPDGMLGQYRQRGMNQVNEGDMQRYVQRGIVNPKWRLYKELPKNYSIRFENEEIMGKGYATFKVRK